MVKARDTVARDIGPALSAATEHVFDSQALSGLPGSIGGPDPGSPGNGQEPKFRNREWELEEVVSALNNDDGEHFWLVVAPPQLGKTWFLRETGTRLERLRANCHVHAVDVRQFTAEAAAHDPMTLLARMYGVSAPSPDPLSIATALAARPRYHLCLLDSAELLSEDTIGRLREGLEKVDQYLSEGPGAGARLALLVASRQDDAWRGIAPLRLAIRKLTEFKEDVVLDALCDLARDTGNPRSRSELRPLAGQVHGLSEGLPALLAGYLEWIGRARWIGLDRLDSRDSFDQIAAPYIEGDLLSPGSLYGRRPGVPPELRRALIEALRALVPYRFFTGSHLSYHAKDDPLRAELLRLRWSEEDLRAAISRTDVLLLPQDEPWHAVSPPIRRLLFRHWYPDANDRARAHQAARAFLESYAHDLAGRERAEATIECLWHEAEALTLTPRPGKAGLLIELAERLSPDLAGPNGPNGPNGVVVPSFRDREVRDFARRRIRDDAELQRAIGDRTLTQAITAIMTRSNGGSMS
jgi:hypothetical protein